MIKIDFKQRKREVLWTVVALFFIAIGVSVFKFSSATSGFEITDELGGNIFLLPFSRWLRPMPRSFNRPTPYIWVTPSRALP